MTRVLVIDGGHGMARRIASRLALTALVAVAEPMPTLGPRGRLDLGPDPSAFDEPQGKRRAQWKAERRGRGR